MSNDGTLIIEDARLVFRNFAGKEGMYNQEGDRNFCLLLDDKLSEQMLRDGWNIKYLKAREEGDTPTPYIHVSLKFRARNGATVRPPTVKMVSSRGQTALAEEEMEILDWIDIRTADVIVRPYRWEMSGKTGVKAYLKSLYVVIEEDYLDQKYSDVPELGRVPLELDNPDVIDAEAWEVEKDPLELEG